MHSMHLSQNIGLHDIVAVVVRDGVDQAVLLAGIAADTYIGIIKMLLGQLHVHGTSRPCRSYSPIAPLAPNSTFCARRTA
jgi:hypothetical protein